jgi:hypothetical protein
MDTKRNYGGGYNNSGG